MNNKPIKYSTWDIERHRMTTEPNDLLRKKKQLRLFALKSDFTMNRLQNKSYLYYKQDYYGNYNYKKLYAHANAFVLYFDLVQYVQDFVDASYVNQNSIGLFDTTLIYYSKYINLHLCYAQVVYALEVNHHPLFADCPLVKAKIWHLDISFCEWTDDLKPESPPSPLRDDGTKPIIKWYTFRPDDLDESKIICIAEREFVPDEIIALFWGKKLKDNIQPSKYAFQNKFGIYDAQRGFTADGSPVFNMGVHQMRLVKLPINKNFIDNENVQFNYKKYGDKIEFAFDQKIIDKHNNYILYDDDDDNKIYPNAILGPDFILRCVTPIQKDDEIIISFFPDLIIKPGGIPEFYKKIDANDSDIIENNNNNEDDASTNEDGDKKPAAKPKAENLISIFSDDEEQEEEEEEEEEEVVEQEVVIERQNMEMRMNSNISDSDDDKENKKK